MLNQIIAFSIRNKLIVALSTLALIGFGIYETSKLPIDAVPDITDNQVQVITVAPSYGAIDIERLITDPIEKVNNNIPGIKEIRSFSRFGLSLVTIVFEDEVNVYWARQQVSERLQQVSSLIPKEIGQPELGPVSTGLGEIYQYVLRAEKGYESKYDEIELRTIQDWIVRRQLLGVKGVAEVSSFGGKLKQYEISINPARLQAVNKSIRDVFTALEENNQNTGGAYIEKGAVALSIRTEGLIEGVSDIENIPIGLTETGTPLSIKDVAEVKVGHAVRYGALTFNDEGEVAGAIVMMLKGANSSEVIHRVKQRIAEIQKTLPKGVILEPFLDRTKMVDNAIGTVEKNLLEGALIVVFVLVLFLGNFRAGFLVASVIPLSMLFAVILMNTFGVSGNLMSLGALDFGLIVDGAVIIVEAVMHQLYHKRRYGTIGSISPEEMDREVNHSAGKMMNSAVFGQIIILVVYLPIFSLEGIEGKMFKPMAQTVAFALLGAFILSLTYVPMMSALVLSKKAKTKANFSDRFMHRIEVKYHGWLLKALRYPKLILTSVLLLFASSIVLFSSLGGEFIPVLEEGDFAVEARVLGGSNLHTTVNYCTKAARILKNRFPEVQKIVSKIGSGEVPTDPMPMEAADMMVILKDKSEWVSADNFDDLAAKMTDALKDLPGLTTSFQYPVQMRFNELMTGAKQDVVCKIFGDDLDTLASYAEKLGSLIRQVDGAKNLYVESVTGMPEIIIDYNKEALKQYQVSVAEVNEIVHTAFAGRISGVIFDDEKRFEILVRLEKDQRNDLDDVQNLLIPTKSGTQLSLNQLADVSIKIGPNQIQREDARRRITVGFNVRGRDVESVVEELQQKVDKQIHLPSGYYVNYGGSFENLNEAKNRLLVAVPISLILIFILLFFAFGSLKQGLLIYTAIPLSAIGGVFFLALRGLPFSISAGIGFIALFGVAVLNGIVLIAEFNRLKKEGLQDLSRIVLSGTKLRLRPVLMTAFVASLGFLPMALSSGAGAEVQRPLATVVIGGLMLATLLTLFVLPILYLLFEKGIGIKTGAAKMVVLFLCGSALSGSLHAQQELKLQQAIDSALKNNQGLQRENLQANYRNDLIKSGLNLPPTGISFQYGQINSRFYDNNVVLSQSFTLPQVYNYQKKRLHNDWQDALLGLAIEQGELKKMVRECYTAYSYLKAKEQLILQSDSLYAGFQEKVQLRFEQGESNILEKTSAESQRGSNEMVLRELRQNLEQLLIEFRWLLNTSETYTPATFVPTPQLALNPDSVMLAAHPIMQRYDLEQKQAALEIKQEKASLYPGFQLAYSNMSMIGSGADNVVYDASTRFQTVQIGVGIPLFYGAQKARIAAAKTKHQVATVQYQAAWSELQKNVEVLQTQIRSKEEQLLYVQSKALPNAKLIQETAGAQYLNGEINYLEWVLLQQQASEIRLAALDLEFELQQLYIQLNHILNL